MDHLMSNAEELLDLSEDQDGELWIVSYADMITLLFGFFVILYSFSTIDDKKFSEVSSDMAKTFKSESKKEDVMLEDSDIEKQLKAFKILVTLLNIADNATDASKKIEAMMDQKKSAEVAKEILNESLKKSASGIHEFGSQTSSSESLTEIILPDLSLFQPGRAELLPAADKKLQRLARDLLVLREIAEIEVVGHTDSSPPGKHSPYRDNFTLSSMRAGVVAQRFIKYGVSENLISVRGMGGLRPIVPEKDQSGRLIPENMAKNRRVHIVLKRRMVPHGG
jgi:chemotaxis protein MotB